MKYSELTRRLRRLGARKIGDLGHDERWTRIEGDVVYRTVIPRHSRQVSDATRGSTEPSAR